MTWDAMQMQHDVDCLAQECTEYCGKSTGPRWSKFGQVCFSTSAKTAKFGRERTTPNPKASNSVPVFGATFSPVRRGLFPVVRDFCVSFPQSRPCTTGIWACTTGWRLALYLCTPAPALGLRVVVSLVKNDDQVGPAHPVLPYSAHS